MDIDLDRLIIKLTHIHWPLLDKVYRLVDMIDRGIDIARVDV